MSALVEDDAALQAAVFDPTAADREQVAQVEAFVARTRERERARVVAELEQLGFGEAAKAVRAGGGSAWPPNPNRPPVYL